jgi:tight adherence protein C
MSEPMNPNVLSILLLPILNWPIWSPVVFSVLIGLAALFVWMAFAPASVKRGVQERVEGYLKREKVLREPEMQQSFFRRVILPALRGILRFLGRLMPQRNVELTRQMLIYAGQPAGLTPLDYYGLQLLMMIVPAGLYFLGMGMKQPPVLALRNTLLISLLGFMIPRLWLRQRVRRRQHEIARALPDALDMMTIGVEAGLAFESAMLRVGEQWHNALTRELERVVAEMRVGTPRDLALKRMVDRTGVPELETFVAVLVQSSQLGVPISQVLHAQAAEMRLKRRQRAEELARQASVKMVFPLIFFIFPAIMVVMLGPAIPILAEFLASMRAGVTGFPMP